MKKQALAVILAGGLGSRLYPLTKDRAKPAVPFGGKYRIIDFTLSNCINSGLRRIIVLTQYKSSSLIRHLRDGWTILNPELGEYILNIPPQMRISTDWYLGTADALYQNLYFINSANPRYTLILSGDHVYKMDYSKLLWYHRRKGAELTIAAKIVPIEDAHHFGVIHADENMRIIGFQEKPEKPKPLPNNPDFALISMGIYVFNTDFMVDVLKKDAQDPHSTHDFGKDIIPALIESHRVYIYPFGGTRKKTRFPDDTYWRDVGTLDAYWEANMDLASVTPKFDLYDPDWPFRTYQGQFPPAKSVYDNVSGGRVGAALDSLVCGGVVISGGRVIRSILSPGVRIHSYAEVTESVLLDRVDVGRRARIRKAIIDKDVKIPRGMEIGFDPEKDAKRFTITESGIVVVPSGIVL
ncbi:MAG: glucose-1-phosphate adenylyltransferase [Deltaproteobacteria bacterium]|nr:MAG: glucose-1-phosphate adenylyltransferase [Deltaproteobacteria bacterium]